MRINKRLPALLLSISLITSLSVPTMAAGSQEIGGLGVVADTQIKAPGNGDTAAVLTQQPTSFSVTVPTQLPIWVSNTGSVATATDVVISNNSNGPVSIKSVTVNPITPWSIATFGTDFSQKEVGLKEFTLQLNGDNASTDGSVPLTPTNWPSILGKSTSPIHYDSDIAVQREALNNVTISTVTFILGWNTNTPIPSQSGVFSVQKLRQEIPKTATSISFSSLPGKASTPPVSPTGPVSESTVNPSGRSLNIPGDISANGDGSILVSVGSPNRYVIQNMTGEAVKSPTRLDGLLSGYTSLTTVDISALDTTNTTSMQSMFSGCTSLTELDLSPINLQGKSLGNIVSNCTNLLTIYVSTEADKAALDPNIDPSITVELKDPTPNETIITYTDGRVEKRDMVGKLVGFRDNKSIKSIEIGKHVTTIDTNAFNGCTNLVSVSIPKSVTTIGNSAFRECTSLKSVSISDSVMSIKTYAFSYCTSLTSVVLPSSLTEVTDYSFDNCTSLASVSIPHGVQRIGEYAFNRAAITSIEIPNSVKIIGTGAFYNCSSLTSVSIPSSVTTISDSAFYNCNSLASVSITSNVTTISAHAFAYCASLTSVSIPEGVITIENEAFNGCTYLTSVSIPSSVTTIGNGAFYNCTSLKSVSIPSGVTTIDTQVFYGCTSLTSVSIPSSVTTIRDSAFYNCNSLASVSIPSSVTTISTCAFSGCTSLTSVSIPSSVTTIGANAFGNVPHIEYHGNASGAPWRAKSMN